MVDVVTLIGVQYLLTSDWTHDAENMEVGVQLGVIEILYICCSTMLLVLFTGS